MGEAAFAAAARQGARADAGPRRGCVIAGHARPAS
jgi:hypothetical protein